MASKKGKKATEETAVQNDTDAVAKNDSDVGGDKGSDEGEGDKKVTSKGRGRPKKTDSQPKSQAVGKRTAGKSKVSLAEDSGSEDEGEEDAHPPKKSKKGRGRPAKPNKATKAKVSGKGRGRPKKV